MPVFGKSAGRRPRFKPPAVFKIVGELTCPQPLAPHSQVLELFADADDGLDRRLEFTADLSERVFDRWRGGGLFVTIDHADHDEVAQALGEHFRRDADQIVLQLGEAAGAAAEIPDDVRGPSAPEEAHTEFQRTGGRRWADFAFAARDHGGRRGGY